MIDTKELRFAASKSIRDLALLPSEVNELLDRLEAAEKSDAESIAMYRKARDERDALRAKVETMERQEPSHWGCTVLQSDGRWKEEVSREVPPEGYFSVRDIFPLYALPGAKAQPAPSVKESIIDDLQAQFDTEGITESGSGDALIRLSDAIAAVEDNFTQPASSVPDADELAHFIRRIDGAHDLGASSLAEKIVDWLAAAPEAKL